MQKSHEKKINVSECFEMSFTKAISVILLSEQLWILDFLNETVSFWISVHSIKTLFLLNTFNAL